MRFIPLLVTALAGTGTLALGHVYLDRLEAEVGGGPKTSVLVAAQDIPLGAALSEAQLASIELPQAYLERRHILVSDVAKVVGSRVTAGLKANEPLLWSDLSEFADSTRVLSGLVPHGMRAVAIKTTHESFNGLLRPGDRVDLLHSVGSLSQLGDITRTLLQNLLVLAVGQDLGAPGAEAPSAQVSRARSVALSVTVAQAQLITQAERHGELTLVLRNADDIALIDDLPETSVSDLGRTKETRLPARASRSVDPSTGSINHVH